MLRMRSMLSRHVAAGIMLAALALPVAAFAQATAPAAPQTPAPAAPAAPAPAAAAPMPMMHKMPQTAQAAVAQVERRITELHRQLHITAEQQQQWDQFAQVMRDNASAFGQAIEDHAGKVASATAVETLQGYADIAALHAQNVQKLVTAFQPLYAALSDQQKKTADVLFRSHGRG
jgi:hypothetical protein